MSHQAFIEYIRAFKTLYEGAPKQKKSELLDQAEQLTRKDRKTVIRYLGRKLNESDLRSTQDGRGRPIEYDPEVLLPHVKRLWIAMERIGSHRMKVALKDWLPFYEHEDFTDEIAIKLELMSKGTLERMVASLRKLDQVNKGLPTTTSALRAMKNRIPINTLDSKIDRPGFTQADTVAHCGMSAAGKFLSTLTLTDIASTWTENRAIAGKTGIKVRDSFIDLRKSLPFELLAINTDSGSEFLNNHVIHFMDSWYHKKQITFTRSRPYHKNDNAYVEQKNYTHVRQLFGYERLEEEGLVELMNEIYVHYWNPLHNFFLPTQKLKEKTREGAKPIKKFDEPRTPYARLLESKHLSQERKDKLLATRQALNPFALAKGLEERLKIFYQLQKQYKMNQREAA